MARFCTGILVAGVSVTLMRCSSRKARVSRLAGGSLVTASWTAETESLRDPDLYKEEAWTKDDQRGYVVTGSLIA